MSNSEKSYPVIKFVVTLNGFKLPADDKQNLENLILKYIRNLIEDLAIPAKFTLSLKFANSKREANFSPFKVSINSKKCRIPLSSKHSKEIKCKKLTSKIVEVIHSNRELLINRAILHSISEQYSYGTNSSLKNLSSNNLHKLIITMVKHGFKLDRCEDFTPDCDTKGWDYLHYFDALIAEVNSTNIKVAYNIEYEEFNKQSSKDNLNDMFTLMQDGLFYELGVVFPKIKWELDENFENNEFQIQINDVNYPSAFGLKPTEYLVNDTVDRLTLLNVKGREAINPANGSECAIIDESDIETCESAGLTTWNLLGYLILYISHQLRKQAGSFLTKDVVKNDLDSLRLAFPALVDTVLSQHDLFTLTWILRDLVDEEISIRDLRNILDNLLCINGTTNVKLSRYIIFQPEGTHLVHSDSETISDLNFADYSNYIRAEALKRYISHKYTRGGNTLVVYLLDPEIEDKIRDLKGKKLSEPERNKLIDAVYREVGNLPPTAQNPVILTTYEIRRQFRKLIKVEFPHLAVLSYPEISPDMNIQPIARISLN